MLMLDANGAVISPSLARQLRAQIALKFGDFIEDLDFWAEMHPTQIIEWENCAIPVTCTTAPPDFSSAWVPSKTFMGFPLELNCHLSPTVVLIRKNREIVAEIGRLGLTRWDTEEVHA